MRERICSRPDEAVGGDDDLTKMIAKAGEPAVLRAYFNGDVAGLRTAVDAATSAGTFDRWVRLMNANNFSGADALM